MTVPLSSRGLVLKERGSAPVLAELELADPGPGEVVVRMVAAGLCQTDLSAVRDARATPLVLGHEGAGIIEELGAGVARLKAGTPVLLCWKAPCGTCSACARGEVERCSQPLETPTDRVSWNGRPITRLLGTGCFSERVLVPVRAVVPLPDTDNLEQAALLGCAVSTGLGAVLRTAGVQPGSSAVVFGAGGVGLNVILGCALAQASTIIAVDPSEQRLDLARHRGATHCTAPALATDLVDTVTHGQGVDYAFEVVGEPSVMGQALTTLGRGGKLTLVGAAARNAVLEFRPRGFMSKQHQIVGCIYGSIRPHADLPLFISWWQDGKIPLTDLIGRTIPLDSLPQAFHDASPTGIRTIVSFP